MLTTQTRSAPAFPIQLRKHSKTFTGCWTCRARKVKCDELRPYCQQCTQKGLDCEGYDVRLQWMPPETSDGSSDSTTVAQAAQAQTRCHRSRVTLGSTNQPTLLSHEIDAIMLSLNALRPTYSSNASSSASRQHQAQLSLQCFGVFDSKSTPKNADVDMPDGQSPQPSSSIHVSGGSPSSSPNTSPPAQADTCADIELLDFDVDATHQHESITLPSPPLDLQHFNHQDSLFGTLPSPQSLDLQQFNAQPSLFGDFPLAFDAYDGFIPLPNSEVVREEEGVKGDDVRAVDLKWLDLLAEIVPSFPSPNELSNQERFLMHHYANRVVHLLTAVDNPKSPWKTIHLPRALQSAGEIVIQGTSTDTKNALRNACLSVSAFSLSNNYRSQHREEEADKWARAASTLRSKAIRDLQLAVNSLVTRGVRFKYKECLATMLSMITVNVMSGDTATCGMHLDGAYRLILQAKGWKTKYSAKAQALHRIYFFLRTIYQSTSTAAPGEIDNPVDGVSSPSIICSLAPHINHPVTGLSPSSNLGEEAEDTSYSLIYGIPHELLVLLNKTVRLVNRAIEERRRTGIRNLSAEMIADSNELEDSIMGWAGQPPSPAVPSPSEKASNNADIIHHMTRAFHNAIILYFAQHVRLLGHFYMQPFITKVIDSIEAIERIKSEVRILATPLYWPAFIAASESWDPVLQERFRKWYDQVDVYGIGSVRTGLRVLEEVWERGPCPGATLTSVWRMVVQEQGTVLLLS